MSEGVEMSLGLSFLCIAGQITPACISSGAKRGNESGHGTNI